MSRVPRVLYREICKLGDKFESNAARKALLIRKEGRTLNPNQRVGAQDKLLSQCYTDLLGSEKALLYLPGRYLKERIYSSDDYTITEPLDNTSIRCIARDWFHKPVGFVGENQQDRYSLGFKIIKRLNEALNYSRNIPSEPPLPIDNTLPLQLLHPLKGLKKGSVLISHPLVSSVFNQSCVLLLEYGQNQGALGVVFNSRVPEEDDIMDEEHFEQSDESSQAFVGGPVHRRYVYYLVEVEPHQGNQEMGNTSTHQVSITTQNQVGRQQIQVSENLYFSGSKLSDLRQYYKKKGLRIKRLKKFHGVSTWTFGQLEREVREGSWLVTDMPQDTFFSNEQDSVGFWGRCMRMLDHEFAHFASFESLNNESAPSELSQYEDEPHEQ